MKTFLFFILIHMFSILQVHAETYRLPFSGSWFVMQGGDTINVNHHMSVTSQSYGLDFIKTGGTNGRHPFKSDGKKVEDYYSWKQKVTAPVAGIIIDAHDEENDNLIGDTNPKKPAGNYVFIETAEKKYTLLAHFKKGSLVVKKGDVVRVGQLLGLCGNSGNTTAPHIHMHTQDSPEQGKGLGYNMHFDSLQVTLSGKKFVANDWPLIRGLFVENQTQD